MVDYVSIHGGQIQQLKDEIEQLKKSKVMSPQLSIQNEFDETTQSNLYRTPKVDTTHDRYDIRRHTGRVQTKNEINNPNPFSTKGRQRNPLAGFNVKYGMNNR